MTYHDLVSRLAKPAGTILTDLSLDKAHAVHMTLGIAGECGELVDAIKKWSIYGKELDYDNIIEELGDLEFYLEGLRQGLRIDRNSTIQANINKLSIRYESGEYSKEQAIARKDKQ